MTDSAAGHRRVIYFSMSVETLERPVQTRPPHLPGASMGRRVLIGIVAVVAVGLLTLALLPDSLWRSLLVKAVTHATGRQASIGSLTLHLLRRNPEITVRDFELANATWAARRPMITMRRFDVSVSWTSLLRFSPVLSRVEVDGPDVDLERDTDNRANWDFSTTTARQRKPPEKTAPTHLPVIRQLIVSDGKLNLADAVAKLTFNGRIAVAERQDSAATPALGVQGSGILNGKPFDLRIMGGALINVDSSKPYEFDAAVTAADIKLTAHTEIRHPFDFGKVSARFHVTGKDLADVYYLTGLALPNTPPYDVSGTLVRDDLNFRIDDFRGRLGASDIGGKIAIDSGKERPKLTAELTSKVLNLSDLAAPLGTQAAPGLKSDTLAQPTGAGGGAGLTGTDAHGKKPRANIAAQDPQANESGLLLPDADLQVNRVRAMDADVQFDAQSVTTGKIPLQRVSFHLLLNDAKITLNPLAFNLPEGQFSGSVVLNARPPVPETDIDMKLDNVDLAQFTSQPGASPLSGRMVGRIRLHGTGTSVHKAAASASGDITVVLPDGKMTSAFAELTGINLDKGLGLLLTDKHQQTEIRCGIASFHADDGDLKANTLVLDTTHVLVTGSGDVNLKNEDLDLSLRGQPKEIRLLRLRSPIQVHGTLAHPDIGLKTGDVVAQAGGAIALGTLLTPVASVLAFVDRGLAKDANCTGLISQAADGEQLPVSR